MKRGSVLYAQVWDHKDFGFLAVTQPPYHFAGVTGVYAAAFVSVCIFGLGVYLALSFTSSKLLRINISVFAVLTYVMSPSFLAVYVENYAVSFAVLGVGLFFRFPFLSGIAFGVSSSIKVTGAPLWIAFLAISLVLRLTPNSRDRLRLTPYVRSILGFSMFASACVFWMARQGSLGAWIDSVTYNAEYAAIRRQGLSLTTDPYGFLIAALPQPTVKAFVFVLISTSLLMALLALEKIGSSEALSQVRYRVVLALLTTGCAGALLVSQVPLNHHHYQYVVGFAVLALAVAFGAWWETQRNTLLVATSLIVFGLPVLVAVTFEPSALKPSTISTQLRAWSTLEDGAILTEEFSTLKEGTSVAFFAGNNYRFGVREMPQDAELACRFFYQFSHMLPRYGKEIVTCLGTSPDVVVIDKSDQWGDAMTQHTIKDTIATTFTKCTAKSETHEIWASSQSLCPHPPGA